MNSQNIVTAPTLFTEELGSQKSQEILSQQKYSFK